MPLFLLTALTMIAFAANSVLNRWALAGGHIDPASFGAVRLISGAVVLCLLALAGGGVARLRAAGSLRGAAALFAYVFGFSFAYLALDAGVGALILFGVVQVTMFAGALLGGETPPRRRWLGAGIAFAGLTWLLWPGAAASVSPVHGALMAVAGVAWGIYSLAGRGARDPLRATAANFALAAPAGLAVAGIWALRAPLSADATGLMLAVLSGAVTSGLGYALWYRVLPRLAPSVAAVAQLSVPVIALLAGAALLGEALTLAILLPAAVVLAGVALSVLPRQKTMGSSGS